MSSDLAIRVENLSKLYHIGEHALRPHVVCKFRAGDTCACYVGIRHGFADISKIRERRGFEPSICFEEGLGELVEWLKTQTAEDRFEEAAGELQAKGLTV